jgi:serine/threonine-protein kinase
MAPEQHRGDPVDARTDVFGFCATLYQMLHGQPPFAGNSIAGIRAQVLAGRVMPPPAGSRAPARWHRLALQGLEPEPARRPADMIRVAEALLADPGALRRAIGAVAAAALATVVPAPPASAARRASRWAIRDARSISRVSAMVSDARANR